MYITFTFPAAVEGSKAHFLEDSNLLSDTLSRHFELAFYPCSTGIPGKFHFYSFAGAELPATNQSWRVVIGLSHAGTSANRSRNVQTPLQGGKFHTPYISHHQKNN